MLQAYRFQTKQFLVGHLYLINYRGKGNRLVLGCSNKRTGSSISPLYISQETDKKMVSTIELLTEVSQEVIIHLAKMGILNSKLVSYDNMSTVASLVPYKVQYRH